MDSQDLGNPSQSGSGSSGVSCGTEDRDPSIQTLEDMLPNVRDLMTNYIKLEHLEDGPEEIGKELMLHVAQKVAQNLAKDIFKKKKKMLQDHKSRKRMNKFYTKRVKKLETDNMTLKHALNSKQKKPEDINGKLHVPFEKYIHVPEYPHDQKHLYKDGVQKIGGDSSSDWDSDDD